MIFNPRKLNDLNNILAAFPRSRIIRIDDFYKLVSKINNELHKYDVWESHNKKDRIVRSLKLSREKIESKTILTKNLKKSDISNGRFSWSKQLSFIYSFLKEAGYNPSKKNTIFDKRLKSFKEKYNKNEFNKIAINEIRTALLWEVRRAHWAGDSVDSKYIKNLYKLLKQKLN